MKSNQSEENLSFDLAKKATIFTQGEVFHSTGMKNGPVWSYRGPRQRVVLTRRNWCRISYRLGGNARREAVMAHEMRAPRQLFSNKTQKHIN